MKPHPDQQNFLQVGKMHCFHCHEEHGIEKKCVFLCTPPPTSCTPACGKWYEEQPISEKFRKENPTSKCQLCGEPMPEGEEMFNYHGYGSKCPKPPLKQSPQSEKL